MTYELIIQFDNSGEVSTQGTYAECLQAMSREYRFPCFIEREDDKIVKTKGWNL